MVFDGGDLARRVARRGGNLRDQFHRALWAGARGSVSVGACGRGGRGDLGRMAAPQMVVLGDAAAGGVHVCVDDLGAVSLCGGYSRRDDYGNARLCHWMLVDGATLASRGKHSTDSTD